MTSISAVDPASASNKAKSLFKAVEKQLGSVPNIFKVLANSPATLEAFLQQSSALAAGALSAQLREQIALITAGQNQCDYCASAHTLLGEMAGADKQELADNLTGYSSDPKTQAALTFASRVIEQRGRLQETELAAIRHAGYSDEEIVEIIAHIGLNIFTNYFNHIAGTEIDFPLVSTEKLAQSA